MKTNKFVFAIKTGGENGEGGIGSKRCLGNGKAKIKWALGGCFSSRLEGRSPTERKITPAKTLRVKNNFSVGNQVG